MSDCVGNGCLYDEKGGLATQYKPISLVNIDEAFVYMDMNQGGVIALLSTRKELDNKVKQLSASDSVNLSKSKNWNTDKGKATIDNMIDANNGEEIYSRDPQYRIVLTPALIKEIQTDNATNGYLSPMTCTNNSAATDYVTCTSDYIHNTLNIEEHFEGDKFTPWHGAVGMDRKTGPAWK